MKRINWTAVIVWTSVTAIVVTEVIIIIRQM
jgi:hypothetical protein